MARSLWLTLTCCCLFLVVGVVLVCIKDWTFQTILKSNFVILPSNTIFPNWVDLPVPVLTSVYFFNVTNAWEVEKNGAKPILKEVGPYVYR